MTDSNEVIVLRHRIEVLEEQLRDCNNRPGYEELRSHTYEVVKANGEQAFRIRDLELALDKAQDDAARLRAVIGQVEWVGSGPHGYCAWCGRWKLQGHAPDCQRQVALGLAQTAQTSEVKA